MYVCIFLSFFVSLLARLRENGWTDLHEIFREDVEWPWDDLTQFWVNWEKPRDAAMLISLSATLRSNCWTDLNEIFRECVEWPCDNLITFLANSEKPRDAAMRNTGTGFVVLSHHSFFHHEMQHQQQTRNTIDCDQSNYSSRTIFSCIPNLLNKVQLEIAPFDPPTAKTIHYNRVWSGSDSPLRKYRHSQFSTLAASCHLGFGLTENSAIGSTDPEYTTLEPNVTKSNVPSH